MNLHCIYVSWTTSEVRVWILALPDFLRSSGLEQGTLSLMSTIEELLEKKNSGFSLENREYGCRDPSRWLHNNPLSTKVGTNSIDKRWLLGQYSLLVNSGQGVCLFVICKLKCIEELKHFVVEVYLNLTCNLLLSCRYRFVLICKQRFSLWMHSEDVFIWPQSYFSVPD
jgi:hypothetical protein